MIPVWTASKSAPVESLRYISNELVVANVLGFLRPPKVIVNEPVPPPLKSDVKGSVQITLIKLETIVVVHPLKVLVVPEIVVVIGVTSVPESYKYISAGIINLIYEPDTTS